MSVEYYDVPTGTGDYVKRYVVLGYDAQGRRILVEALALTQPVEGDVGGAGEQPVMDVFDFQQDVADQVGAGGVLTFTLPEACEVIWVLSRGAVARARIGSDAAGLSATRGAYCDDGVPTPLTARGTVVKVWAPAEATVSVWGFGRET